MGVGEGGEDYCMGNWGGLGLGRREEKGKWESGKGNLTMSE